MSVCHERSSLSNQDAEKGQECDISGLLEMLEAVTDRRSKRGRIYGLVFLLAASLVAVLAGATNFRQIHDQIADFPQPLLAKLGAKWCYFRGRFGWPSERTIRRVLENIDADELDRVAGAWLLRNVRDDDGALRHPRRDDPTVHHRTMAATRTHPGPDPAHNSLTSRRHVG